ncbi:uncharacterized protein LAJ45_02258 [Morchella importuna]|uniref:uncharacterized protein n=1 Tax=Morchella importuna TaxID=1174673 RepID=UPI001E8ECFAC|nr:uncharacterized protein LAJ45_02258 [Morchella importuna]KAH8153445.1 hypothetical protein LAJ45_02258 [Morchella importuna]
MDEREPSRKISEDKVQDPTRLVCILNIFRFPPSSSSVNLKHILLAESIVLLPIYHPVSAPLDYMCRTILPDEPIKRPIGLLQSL